MKTDRLYGITVYLLNHGQTSASELARHFEVSVRTIQRDIDSLCCAGIPIIAANGSNGGYAIAEGFKMDGHVISQDEFSYMLTALKGLSSVTRNAKTNEIYEKVLALSGRNNHMGMVLDFSVLREGDEKLLQMLQTAVLNRKAVEFTYTNNSGETRIHCVEPVAVIYRWYAWYLLAYSEVRKDYRIYKLVRMENARITDKSFTKEHMPAEDILAESNKSYKENVKPTKVTLKCSPGAVYRIREYLNGKVTGVLEDGYAIMEIHVVENEQWWIGVILSLEDTIEIQEPEYIRKRVVTSAKKILSLYQEL